MKKDITRRTFIKGSGLMIAACAAPGGLVNVSLGLAGDSAAFKPHAFLEIATDETVTVWVGQTELGQGTHTGIGMILADELGADWERVQVKQALAGEPFKDPLWHMQFTGGSTSLRHRWDLFRNVAAAAREVLIQAAVQEWRGKPADCRAENGRVLHSDGRSISFGQLCQKAAALSVPEKPPLKDPQNYRIIGSRKTRLDIPDKVAGRTQFGIDFNVPNMIMAAVARPPVYGAKPLSFDEKAAKAMPGVLAVVPLEDKVAVCAQTTYAALQLLAEKSNWGGPVPSGRSRGIALRSCFGSTAGHVAEVSVDQTTGKVKVHKVICAVDCGPAVYPDAITAQMEGGVVMALSVAFYERISFANGGVQTGNYDEYPLLTMTEVPEIEVHIAQSRHKIGGIGELGIPTVAPAVANAVAKAVGVRLRGLPIDREQLKKA